MIVDFDISNQKKFIKTEFPPQRVKLEPTSPTKTVKKDDYHLNPGYSRQLPITGENQNIIFIDVII